MEASSAEPPRDVIQEAKPTHSSSPRTSGSPQAEQSVPIFDIDSEVMEREPSETPVHRKVLPRLEEEPNVCSICLDEFIDEDPAMQTRCG
jgi:hypothetical protein